MRRPSIEALAPELAALARAVATRLRAAGHGAWLVGGAVRDLALELPAHDVDLATDATPDEIEGLFEHTKGVGRAFGTLLVIVDGVAAQVTTFRSEHGHSDARRPDRVSFGLSPEEDALRRDFTCNALFLDPLDDTLLDPSGGLEDLRAGRLRCVGDPRARFREDGLRLVRLARFAAALELAPEAATLAAASACSDAVSGVSGERLLGELAAIFARPRAHVALRLLDATGVLERALPGQAALHPPGVAAADARELRWRALERLGGEPAGAAGFSVLLDPSLGAGTEQPAPAEAVLAHLRPANELREALRDLLALLSALRHLARNADAPRSARIRVLRRERFEVALRLARAWDGAGAVDAAPLARLAAERNALSGRELRPAPWITARDLELARVPRGPAWGALLVEAETLQLDGVLAARADAQRWLARRAAELGGGEHSA